MKKNLIDPLITQPEPITLVLPVIEQTLKIANIRVSRDEIVKRFFKKLPRVLIVTGAVDHPAQIYDYQIAKALIKKLWKNNTIPFITSIPAICDGIAQGHYGMRFSLKSRNLTAEFLANHIIAHHYNGAIFITSCDKRPSADLAAAIIVDKLYQRLFQKYFFAMFINTPVMKDILIPAKLKEKFADIIKIIPEDILTEKLRCNVYAKYYKTLHSAVNLKKISGKKIDKFLNHLAEYTCPTGGTCPFLGTGNTSKFMLFGLGVVPDEFAFMTPEKFLQNIEASDKIIKHFIKLINKNLKEYSITEIVKNNFENAIRLFSTISGSLNWFLHFEFLSDTLQIGYNRKKILKVMENIPVYFDYSRSIYDFANSSDEQKKVFGFLFKKEVIKDTLTISGKWSSRITKNFSNKLLFLLEKPFESPFMEFKGNFFESALIKITPQEKKILQRFHNKLFLTKIYYSEETCNQDLLNPKNLLLKVLKSTKLKTIRRVEQWNNGEIKIALFILKEGFKADGMPEMYYSTEYINSDLFLRNRTILLTDGRFSGATYGFAFGYMLPEAVDSKKLLNLKDGMILHFDAVKKRINILKE